MSRRKKQKVAFFIFNCDSLDGFVQLQYARLLSEKMFAAGGEVVLFTSFSYQCQIQDRFSVIKITNLNALNSSAKGFSAWTNQSVVLKANIDTYFLFDTTYVELLRSVQILSLNKRPSIQMILLEAPFSDSGSFLNTSFSSIKRDWSLAFSLVDRIKVPNCGIMKIAIEQFRLFESKFEFLSFQSLFPILSARAASAKNGNDIIFFSVVTNPDPSIFEHLRRLVRVLSDYVKHFKNETGGKVKYELKFIFESKNLSEVMLSDLKNQMQSESSLETRFEVIQDRSRFASVMTFVENQSSQNAILLDLQSCKMSDLLARIALRNHIPFFSLFNSTAHFLVSEELIQLLRFTKSTLPQMPQRIRILQNMNIPFKYNEYQTQRFQNFIVDCLTASVAPASQKPFEIKTSNTVFYIANVTSMRLLIAFLQSLSARREDCIVIAALSSVQKANGIKTIHKFAEKNQIKFYLSTEISLSDLENVTLTILNQGDLIIHKNIKNADYLKNLPENTLFFSSLLTRIGLLPLSLPKKFGIWSWSDSLYSPIHYKGAGRDCEFVLNQILESDRYNYFSANYKKWQNLASKAETLNAPVAWRSEFQEVAPKPFKSYRREQLMQILPDIGERINPFLNLHLANNSALRIKK